MNNDPPPVKAHPVLIKKRDTGKLGIDVALSGKSNEIQSFSPEEFIDLVAKGNYEEKSRVRLKPRGAAKQANGFPIRNLIFSNEMQKELDARKSSV